MSDHEAVDGNANEHADNQAAVDQNAVGHGAVEDDANNLAGHVDDGEDDWLRDLGLSARGGVDVDDQADDGGRLAREVGALFRAERERRNLRQADVADRSGVRQQQVSRFEAGRRAVGVGTIERLFATLGLQVQVAVEAVDSHLDAEIAMVRADLGRLRDNWASRADFLHARRPQVPLVADGALAALLHNVPIKPEALEFAVAEADLDALAEMLMTMPNTMRMDARWGDFRSYDRDPRRPGPMWWRSPYGDVKVRVVTEMPAPIVMTVDDIVMPVMPLAAVSGAFPVVARVMARVMGERGSARHPP